MGANPSGSRQEIPVPNDGEVSKWSMPPTENGDSWINQPRSSLATRFANQLDAIASFWPSSS